MEDTMTREERTETAFAILMGGWIRIRAIMELRLGRSVSLGDKPTSADLEAYRRARPVTDQEIKSVYRQPQWDLVAERIINQCRAILAA
jgi:hypothetical protein